MNYKRIFLMLLVTLMWHPIPYDAETKERLLLLYMTADGEMNERTLMVEANLAYFVDSIDSVPAEDLRTGVIQDYSHVVLIGDEEGEVPQIMQRELEKFTGRFLVFGYNAEQFSLFNEWQFLDEQRISRVEEHLLENAQSIVRTIPPTDATILAEAKTIDQTIPYIAQKGKVGYIATTAFSTNEKYELSRALYTLFDVPTPSVHPAYIRLEGISPLSDAKNVRKMGEYLLARDIPVLLSVAAHDKDNLASNKQLVRVLQSLQKRGALLIATPSIESSSFLKKRSQFTSDEAYMNQLQAETDAMRKSYHLVIEALVQSGLYPVASNLAHDKMTANDYSVTADYFSAVFGGMQVETAAIFITQPSLLSGMVLYPQTIGYVNPNEADPLQDMKKNLKHLQTVPGTVLGGDYPSYLGMDYLPELVKAIESVPGAQWLDFSSISQTPTTESLSKQTKKWAAPLRQNPFNTILWIVVAVVIGFLLAFSIHTLSLRLRLKKRLFEERARRD